MSSFFHGLCFSDVIVPVIDIVLHDALETLLEKQLHRAGDPHQTEHQIKVVPRGIYPHLHSAPTFYLKHPYQNYYGETHVRRFSLPALEPFDEDHMRDMSLLFANDDFETDVAKQLQNVKLICKAFYCAVFMALKKDNPKHAYKIHWSQLPTTCVRFPAHDGSYCFRQMRMRPSIRIISETREEYNYPGNPGAAMQDWREDQRRLDFFLMSLLPSLNLMN